MLRVLCLTLTIFSALPCLAAEVAVSREGRTSVSAPNKRLLVLIETKRADHDDKLGCTQSRTPCSLVSNMKIILERKPIYVPRSVFCDLSDVRSADVIFEKGHNVLVLEGGDGAEGYKVRITISQSVDQREILSGLTSSVLQRTYYFTETLE